jgi:AcrR family transcriptional regulator
MPQGCNREDDPTLNRNSKTAKKVDDQGIERAVLKPQRANGRERVNVILDTAAEVFRERGFEAATMKEIAERSGTKVGSLYRFFPTKELIADVLVDQYAAASEKEWGAIIAVANTQDIDQLSDTLLGTYVSSHGRHKAFIALLESGVGSSRRDEFRNLNLQNIAKAIRTHSPHISAAIAKRVAVIVFYNMRTMMALTFDRNAAQAPGAVDELKESMRAYLRHRLNDVRG